MLIPLSEIVRAISAAPWRQRSHPRCVPAAVLLPLVNRDQGAHVLIIERARDQSPHSGQMAFPGGKLEAADRSTAEAALREAGEEINLRPEQVQVLGSMGYFRTMTSRFDAAVTLGSLPPELNLRRSREVANIFEIPLASLLMDFDPSLKTCTRGGLLNLHFHVQPREVNRTICIWGLTARILHHFFLALHLLPQDLA